MIGPKELKDLREAKERNRFKISQRDIGILETKVEKSGLILPVVKLGTNSQEPQM